MFFRLASKTPPDSFCPEGYIQLNELLRHKCFKGRYGVSDIERVVNNNSKQRFKLRRNPLTNTLEIKATQGHSIAQINDTELTPILEAKYKTVVHGTYKKYWPLIKQQGLSRMTRKHIHLAKGLLNDPNVISGLRKDTEVYIFINLERALAEGIKFYESENGVILTEGNDNGILELKYFSKVTESHTVTNSQASTSTPPTFKEPSPPSTSQSSPAKAVQKALAKRPVKKQAQFSKPQPNTSNGQAENMSAAINNVRNKKDLCKIEVSGYPSYVKAQDLYQLFCGYGDVRVEHVGKKYAVLCFSSTTEAECAVKDSTKVFLYGQFLTIKAFSGAEEFRKQNIKTIKTVVEMIPPDRLALTGTFEEQLGALLAAVRLTQEEVSALAALYSDVERVLQPIWPGCQAMPFGSLTTGLGVKASDADCFVNIPPQHHHPQASFVARARRVLQQYPQLFTEVLGIPRANTPIVKFLHIPTRTRCDLSFKTPLGALNSKLVAFLLHADPRFVPTAVLAKYWASTHRLSGTGKLTNYALTLLLLFYLQQRGLLPSVESLQRDEAHKVLVDGWNSGFTPDYSHLPRISDTGTVADILGGFFAFYATFDFEELVVCPYLGRPIKKEVFLDHNLLPEEFGRYRRNVEENYATSIRVKVPLCVQDPFEQSHNVASAVTVRLAADIKEYIQFAAEAYEKEKTNGCRDFLRTILLEKPRTIRAKSHPEYRVTFYPRVLDAIDGAWRKVFTDTVVTVFERILKLKLSPDGEPDGTRNKRERERFVATLSIPLWKRKRFARLYESVRMGFVEKHARITDEVLNVEQPICPIEFQVMVSYCEKKARSAWLSVRMMDGEVEDFRAFGKYYVSSMQNLVLGTLHASGSLSPREPRTGTVGVVASNLDSSDLDSDNVADDQKVSPNPDAENAALKLEVMPKVRPGKATEKRRTSRTRNKEEEVGSTQVPKASAENGMAVDQPSTIMEVESPTVEPTQVIEKQDESPMVVEPEGLGHSEVKSDAEVDQEAVERSSMEVEHSAEVKEPENHQEEAKSVETELVQSECSKSNEPVAAT